MLIFTDYNVRQENNNSEEYKKATKTTGFVADKLFKLADISHNTIIKIESGGIQSPTIDTVQRIAKALGVSVDILLK